MADQVLEALLRASLQGGAYAAAVWLACRLFPRLPAGMRALLWWLVSLKFLVALAGPAPIPLPVLPASAAGTVVVERATSVLPAGAVADVREKSALPLAAVLLWAGVLSFGLLRGAKQLARARRLRRSARPALAPEAETFARLRARLGVPGGVELKLSPDVSAPQVLGPWRPVVLLPSAAAPLPPEELEMALAHELLHVRRKDLWLSLVPETARLLFWFHPLARLAAREELLAREAACDASVLRALHRAPREYGRLLLRFGIVPSLPGAAQGAPSLQSLRRRLEMLDHVHGKTARLAGLALAVLGFLALVPFAAVARDSSPAPQAHKTDTPPAALPASYRGASEEPDTDVDVDVDSGGREVSVVDAQEDAESFILHHGDSTTMFMSTKADGRAFKQLQRKEGDFFYYRDGSRQWVIRDTGILAEAFRILEPMEQLGEQQGAIGETQGKIGEKQGALGEQQGMLGERMGLLEEERDRLSDDGGGTDHLDRERDTLDSRMEELGAQMEVLGREMDQLGRQMDKLGAQMDEASKQARDDLRRLAEDAVRRGIAKPLAL